jgi:hypothetical protein
MLCREAVNQESTEHTNTGCEQNEEFLVLNLAVHRGLPTASREG